MVFYRVYMLLCNATGKAYIGVTSDDVEARWKHHVRCSKRGSTTRLHKAIAEHGEHVFATAVLDVVVGEQDAAIAEKYWIAFHDTKATGYNMTCGGDVTPPHSAKTKKAIGKALRAQWKDPIVTALRKARMGESLSDPAVRAHRSYLSSLRKGEKRSSKGRKNIAKGAQKRWANPQQRILASLRAFAHHAERRAHAA